MALDDYIEPEVGIAILVTAAVASPRVRKFLRQGAVYGVAGALMAKDKLTAAASEIAENVRKKAEEAAAATEPTAEEAVAAT